MSLIRRLAEKHTNELIYIGTVLLAVAIILVVNYI